MNENPGTESFQVKNPTDSVSALFNFRLPQGLIQKTTMSYLSIKYIIDFQSFPSLFSDICPFVILLFIFSEICFPKLLLSCHCAGILVLKTILLPSSVPVGRFQLSPIWTENCIISDNYHPPPPQPPPRIVVNWLPMKLKFGMEALFDQARSTS